MVLMGDHEEESQRRYDSITLVAIDDNCFRCSKMVEVSKENNEKVREWNETGEQPQMVEKHMGKMNLDILIWDDVRFQCKKCGPFDAKHLSNNMNIEFNALGHPCQIEIYIKCPICDEMLVFSDQIHQSRYSV